MPLTHDFHANVREMVQAGHPVRQAIAAAHAHAQKLAKGGSVEVGPVTVESKRAVELPPMDVSRPNDEMSVPGLDVQVPRQADPAAFYAKVAREDHPITPSAFQPTDLAGGLVAGALRAPEAAAARAVGHAVLDPDRTAQIAIPPLHELAQAAAARLAARPPLPHYAAGGEVAGAGPAEVFHNAVAQLRAHLGTRPLVQSPVADASGSHTKQLSPEGTVMAERARIAPTELTAHTPHIPARQGVDDRGNRTYELAHGGSVPSHVSAFHHTLADGLQQALHAHVQQFATGGNVAPPEVIERVEAEAPRNSVMAGPPPKAAYPAGPVPFEEGYTIERPKSDSWLGHAAPKHESIPGLNGMHAAMDHIADEAKHAPPEVAEVASNMPTPAPAAAAPAPKSELDSLEEQRRAAIAAGRPGLGERIGRIFAGAALGAAHRDIPDFAKEDREREAGVNAEFGLRKDAYLKNPSAEAARAGALNDSTQSLQLRNLVGTIIGDPKAVEGMSAEGIQRAQPFIGEYLQAKRAGDVLAMTNAQNQIKNALAMRKLGIDQQNANANASKAGQAKQALQDSNTKTMEQILIAARGDPGFTKSEDALRRVETMRPLMRKRVMTTKDIDLLTTELANAANGGPDQELAKHLNEPTIRGELSKALQHITGQPGDAGYDAIVRQVLEPYVNDLERSSHRIMGKRLKTITDDFGARPGFVDPAVLAQVRRDAGDHLTRAGGDNAAPAANSAWDAVQ